MGFISAIDISASGLRAQRLRMRLISSNLANVSTTRTPEGGPYKRKEPVFAAVPSALTSFSSILDQEISNNIRDVQVLQIAEDKRAAKQIYDPSHPDADSLGYVAMPNINLIEEMADLLSATRSYEANVTVIEAAKEMARKSMEIGR